MKDCKNCDLYKTRTRIVWGTPRPYRPCSILMVGEAPGADEDEVGKPFVGGAGRLLRAAVHSSGLKSYATKGQIAVTNVVRCRPPGNRKPFQNEIEACFPNLLDEIDKYKPEMLIPLGEIALNTVGRCFGITAWQGTPTVFQSIIMVPAFHPAYAIRQKGYMLAIINVFNKAASYLEAGFKKTKTKYIYDPPAYELRELLELHHNLFEPYSGFAFDLETTGLNPFTDKLIGFSFSGIEGQAVSVALNRKDPYNDPRWKTFEPWLQDPTVSKTVQNASFDLFWLRVQGHPVSSLGWDTKLAAGMLYSDLPRDLSWLRSWYTDILPYKEAARKKGVWNLSPEELNLYSCRDADVTWRVRKAQEKDMEGTQLKETMSKITVPLTEALINIMHRGVLVDKAALVEMLINVGPKKESIEKKYPHINLDSPMQVAEELHSRGFRIPRTAKGNFKTDKKTIGLLSNQGKDEFLDDILYYRHQSKIISTYLIGLSKVIQPDGRVHTLLDSSGTSTGRLSSSGPNLQNQPDEVRRLFVPDPGYYFLDADYKMLELLVAAIQAKEQTILDKIASGVYIHGDTYKLIFKKDLPENYTQHDVGFAKRLIFGIIYGRGARSIAIELKVSEVEAQTWINILLDEYPELLKWREANIEEWKERGYLTSVFGRVRHCNSVTEALNFKVQSAAGDVCSTSLTLLERDAKNTGILPLLPVHDEILVQVPNEISTEDSCKYLRGIMSRKVPELNNYQFPIDIKTGPNWGEVEKIK